MESVSLRNRLDLVLQQQANLRGSTSAPTGFNKQTAEYIFSSCSDRVTAARADDSSKPVTIITAETGTGKSTYSWAFIVAMLRNDPSFTAAMCLPTIKLLSEVVNEVQQILKPDEQHWLRYWTSAHCPNAPESRRADRPYVEGQERHDRESLKSARFILATHDLWKQEQESDADNGVTYTADGRLRDLLILDESPALSTAVEIGRKDIVSLMEACLGADGWEHEVEILKRLESRMQAVSDGGQMNLEAPVERLISIPNAELFHERRLRQLVKESRTSGVSDKLPVNRHQFARHLSAIENGYQRGVYEQQALPRRIQERSCSPDY
ncbi:DEAD/DEAH box helicase family protein [Congregibacter litoralis]|uniref:DEAD/DEAH box helicase n=1 Tax=Congregibacter litoralis KT71 TaxID=314285 RepID=A4ADI0_9GAMM|nr:DEAD/DEAH box helicase family protein [Congregibacter litoralis]EAQ95978.1 DEAD/DEAH box helicase [Congregibacter litoralis KT71]